MWLFVHLWDRIVMFKHPLPEAAIPLNRQQRAQRRITELGRPCHPHQGPENSYLVFPGPSATQGLLT